MQHKIHPHLRISQNQKEKIYVYKKSRHPNYSWPWLKIASFQLACGRMQLCFNKYTTDTIILERCVYSCCIDIYKHEESVTQNYFLGANRDIFAYILLNISRLKTQESTEMYFSGRHSFITLKLLNINNMDNSLLESRLSSFWWSVPFLQKGSSHLYIRDSPCLIQSPNHRHLNVSPVTRNTDFTNRINQHLLHYTTYLLWHHFLHLV